MPKEPFMLVSLDEDKARRLAQVISNPTCTKILNYLAGKDATESDIAKELKLPLSTVHYNLQQLSQAKLVTVEEFHYSKKGREINHYTLANKYIIIAPQDEHASVLDKLKNFLPTILITAVAAIILLFTKLRLSASVKAVETTLADTSAPMVFDAAQRAGSITDTTSYSSLLTIDSFLIGALFVIIVSVLVELYCSWRKK